MDIEISPADLRRRFFEVLPAALSWTTLIGLAVLAFVIPYWIAIFVIAYDLYALIRAGYISVHLVYAYRRLRLEKKVDWIARCRGVSGDLATYRNDVQREYEQLRANPTTTRQEIKNTRNHLRSLNSWVVSDRQVPHWESVHHAIILPTYDESLSVLRSSLDSLVAADFPHERLHVVVGFEERARYIGGKIGPSVNEKARILESEYVSHFGSFITTFHPEGLPGETKVKSANAAWAIKRLEEVLRQKGIEVKNTLVSNFDSDTVVAANYFGLLTYTFITTLNRYQASYQPLPIYNNNIWDAPAFSRVIASGSTFWQMIESTRPERLVTFSSHSMTLKALKDVGYWHRDKISEDSRIFWQCLLHYDGDYRTVPLYTTVSMDAALAPTMWQTFVNQYKQKRRWGWGIENFPYLAEGFVQNKRIPFSVRFHYLWRTLEGHWSWATAPIIIAGLGWLPIFFGGPAFHATVLSYSLPYMARTIMTIAMAGLIVSTALTLLLLPKLPSHVSAWRYSGMILQWALVPFIATLLSAFPALDAETRLALGRDLQFNVMQKSRRDSA